MKVSSYGFAFSIILALTGVTSVNKVKRPNQGSARDILDKSELEKIKRVATQDNRKRYQEVMKAIKLAVERGGREGIDIAHRTASYAVQMAFRWTPEYLFALRQYENRLRAIRQSAGSKR